MWTLWNKTSLIFFSFEKFMNWCRFWGLLGMYFDAVVVEVEKNLLLFRLALAILWDLLMNLIHIKKIIRLLSSILQCIKIKYILFKGFSVYKPLMFLIWFMKIRKSKCVFDTSRSIQIIFEKTAVYIPYFRE